MKWATFGRRRYKVWIDARVMGFADLPSEEKEHVIYVDPELRPKAHLETAVHEALHAAFPTLTEAEVERAGREIGRFLWQLDYRRVR